VQLGHKDVEDWEKKSREGYETAFAVLRIELLFGLDYCPSQGYSYWQHPARKIAKSDDTAVTGGGEGEISGSLSRLCKQHPE
jgi:hypothetical protein